MMRIKDSDDYITARAANPRTGQISPSVLSSPGPKTPETPGAALKLACQGTPPIRYHVRHNGQANEGKRVNKVAPAWLAGNGAFRDTSCADLVLPTMPTRPMIRAVVKPLRDDDFVVKMPSAREPQPYAYPGHSNNEIQAFEHYKRKTKRTSTDGYDRRLVDHSAMDMNSPGIQDAPTVRPLNVIKRRGVPSQDTVIPDIYTTATDAGKVDPYRHFSADSVTTVVQCEPARDASGASVSHLNQLPRVQLVHPSLAGAAKARTCSLGCAREGADACVESRKTSQQSAMILFPAEPPEAAAEVMEVIFLALTMLWQSFRDFVLAQTSALSKLLPQNLTTWEKLMIVRSLFCLLIRIAAVSIVVTLTWRLTGIALQMIRLIFWPLEMIIRAVLLVTPTRP